MADIVFPNINLGTANNAFMAIWKLSRAMKKAGWTYKSSGDSSSKDVTGVATSDLWGGNADPALDSNPIGTGSAAWWCAQGPTTLKIPISSAPTGVFIRGERVNQATSSAEGELVGYDFDGSSTGHVVVLPRVGTFDSTHVVTGAVSGATFTPSAALSTYVREIVIFKNTNATAGSIYFQCVSNEGENASRFSVIAADSGCTASLAPGAGSSGNAFPANGSYVVCGSIISGSVTHSNWFTIASTFGVAQAVAVNNTHSTGVSQDGSFWALIGGDVSSSTAAQFIGYFRCDNSEDGDIDPFVWYKSGSVALNAANTAVNNTGGSQLGSNIVFSFSPANSPKTWLGWRRRGFSTGDAFNAYNAVCLGYIQQTAVLTDNNGVPETIACSYTSKRLREPIFLAGQDNTLKGRKGSPRWMSIVQGGTTFDTYDAKQKLIICPANGVNPAVVVGPWDGTTTPLQA